jgi:AraC-like DNA-binding protein
VNRKKGTSTRNPADTAAVVTYRELAPSRELRAHVRAFYSFTPGGAAWQCSRAVTREVQFTREDSFCSPRFADGQASLVIDLGATCELGSGWTFGTPIQARAIGALRKVGAPAGNARPEMIGVYFEPGAASALLHASAQELTDQAVNLEHLWGSQGARLAEDLAELDEPARVDRLESVLLARVRRAPAARLRVDVAGLARWVRANPASMTVGHLAEAAGVSRQHLTRVFRRAIGVSPKRYCRVARFQRGLVYAGAGASVQWAEVAAELGYADQSHMIAEFRELSSLTPETLATQRWFHPFILEARSRFEPVRPVRRR